MLKRTLHILALVIVLALLLVLASRREFILHGVVLDASNGQPVPGAMVSMENRRVITDLYGAYLLETTREPRQLYVVADGYAGTQVSADSSEIIRLAATPATVLKRWFSNYADARFGAMLSDMEISQARDLSVAMLTRWLTAAGFTLQSVDMKTARVDGDRALLQADLKVLAAGKPASLSMAFPLVKVAGLWRIVWPVSANAVLRCRVQNGITQEAVRGAKIVAASRATFSDEAGLAELTLPPLADSIRVWAPGFQVRVLSLESLEPGLAGLPPIYRASLLKENVYPLALLPVPPPAKERAKGQKPPR